MTNHKYWRVVFVLVLIVFLKSVPVRAQAGLTILLHQVDVQPLPDQSAYDVSLAFSLLDNAGNAIKDLTKEDVTVLEDGQAVDVLSLDPAEQEPISILLLLDTSGSMTGSKIQAVREAAASFISRLEERDRLAVVSFDRVSTTRLEFSTDHQAGIEVVQLLETTPGGATCLYDAVYGAMQMLAREPFGRRALILLTDGVDEIDGKPCSHFTLDDVIALATDSNMHVPVYTIGLGTGVDQVALTRLAENTQGRFQYSPDETRLQALFGRLSDELSSQYVLHYLSHNDEPGEHPVVLQVAYNGKHAQTETFVDLPPLPYRLVFLSPQPGQEISDEIAFQIEVKGQGSPIDRVVFLVNGQVVGADDTPPYEYRWPASDLEAGKDIFVEAVAYDENGIELARNSMTVHWGVSTTPDVNNGQGERVAGEETKTVSGRSNRIISQVGGALLAVLLVLILIWRRRKQQQMRDDEWERHLKGVSSDSDTPSSVDDGGDDRTFDALIPSSNARAVLVVLQSDDPDLVHQRLEITKSVTTLGRKPDNDLVFPKDSPVSRHHAVLEERDGVFFLSEVLGVDDRNQPKPPTYGTFVNGTQVQDMVRLRDGDEIQLGKRLRMRFETVLPVHDEQDHTLDQWTLPDDDRTLDNFRG